MNSNKSIIKFLKQYWIVLLLAISGVVVVFDIANIVVLLQGIGIVSFILLLTSLILDDKADRGLFPAYDESELIEICKEDPVASAIVIVTKNILVMVVIILTYFFIKP